MPFVRHHAHFPATHDLNQLLRKSRGKDSGIPKSSGQAADSLLRLCPALEARISDLRRDNTAAARFLNKAQVALVSPQSKLSPTYLHVYECPRDRQRARYICMCLRDPEEFPGKCCCFPSLYSFDILISSSGTSFENRLVLRGTDIVLAFVPKDLQLQHSVLPRWRSLSSQCYSNSWVASPGCTLPWHTASCLFFQHEKAVRTRRTAVLAE